MNETLIKITEFNLYPTNARIHIYYIAKIFISQTEHTWYNLCVTRQERKVCCVYTHFPSNKSLLVQRNAFRQHTRVAQLLGQLLLLTQSLLQPGDAAARHPIRGDRQTFVLETGRRADTIDLDIRLGIGRAGRTYVKRMRRRRRHSFRRRVLIGGFLEIAMDTQLGERVLQPTLAYVEFAQHVIFEALVLEPRIRIARAFPARWLIEPHWRTLRDERRQCGGATEAAKRRA